MSTPTYRALCRSEIEEIEIDGGFIRLLSGSYENHKGHQSEHLPLDYYDVHLDPGKELVLHTAEDASVMAFTLLGDAVIAGESIDEKTAVKLTEGNELILKGAEQGSQVLVMISRALNEPIAWAGPIVMNTNEELNQAFDDLHKGTFIRNKLDFKPEQ